MKRYDDEIFPLHHHRLFMVADFLISMLNTCTAPRLTKYRLLGLPKLQATVRPTGIKMESPMATRMEMAMPQLLSPILFSRVNS